MSTSGGAGNTKGGSRKPIAPDSEADDWGIETQVTGPGADATDAEPSPFGVGEVEEVTGSQYFSDEELEAVQAAANAAIASAPPPEPLPTLPRKQRPAARLEPAGSPEPETRSLSRQARGLDPQRAAAPASEPPKPTTDTSLETVRPRTVEPPQPAPKPAAPLAAPRVPRIEEAPAAASRTAKSRSIPPPPFATPSMMPPPKSYDDASPALASYQAFRSETYRLARTRDYRSIAALHESALETVAWATSEEYHVSLLLDLARLYRDRLSDKARAQQTFERVVQQRPGHVEAMEYLEGVYQAQGNMKALHGLYAMAVDEEWGPERRIELTRNAARIALDHLHDAALAARDWERLLELGDLDGQVTVELSRVYREAARWSDLGEFLQNRAAACTDSTRVAVLREAIEAFLSGARKPDRAESLIQEIVATQPEDTVALASLAGVRAQQGRWAELEQIAKMPMSDAPAPARLDVLRLVAELLSAAGEHDRAAIAYERVLQFAPTDRDAIAAREQHLQRMGDHKGLVQFLVARAEKARKEEDRATRYQRAAEVADQALSDPELSASLWQKSVAANPNNAAAYEALVAIYDRLNDVAGVTGALEGLAKITRDPKARAKVLRRLGDHYAYRADNDDQAQRCWLEVASNDPDDMSVQRELNGIHRRRGDFQSLDAALTRQLWRTTDREQAVGLAREVAANLDENLQQPERTVRAWLHLLDLAPEDEHALGVLWNKLSARTATTEAVAVGEVRLSRAVAAQQPAARIEVGLEIAEACEKRGETQAAIAAYERVRAWAPTDDRALRALVRLQRESNPRAAISALEIAAAHASSVSEAIGFLSRMQELLPADDAKARFFLLRRLLRLGAGDGLEGVVDAAGAAGAWRDLAAIYERLAEMTSDPAKHRELRLRLARLCEEKLGDAHRAYVALQSLALSASAPADMDELRRLAESTSRWEDLLAVLDASLGPDTPHEVRQQVLIRRADVCETKLNDPHRAFLELHRLVQGRQEGELDAVENEALRQMHRIAGEHGLLVELEAVYDELWDRAPSNEARIRIARARQSIRRDHLGDAVAGLEQALLVLRLDPSNEEMVAEVLMAAESLGRWDRALPVVEGVWRAVLQDAARLTKLATHYRDRCNDHARATELMAEVLRLEPENTEAQAMLESAAEQCHRWPRAVLAMRLAAARTSPSPRALELARKAASVYAEKLGDLEASLEVRRWILQIWPDDLESLEILINAHREKGEHGDLRGRLEQWIERVSDTSRHVDRWLEVGRLCRDSLSDPAGALVAYSNVVELDASNEEAVNAMRSLANVSLPPALRRKQVKVELARATGERRMELLGQLADLEQEMGRSEAAVAALRELFALEGGDRLAKAPLARLLRDAESWSELAALEEEAAGRTNDVEARQEHLRSALAVAEKHLDDAQLIERLIRKLLELVPEDHESFFRLTRLLRATGRFAELADALRDRLERHAAIHEPFELRWMERELARLRALVLDASKDAEAMLRTSATRTPPDAGAALWLARLALGRQDHTAYLDLRKRHLGTMPKHVGGLVICHLAEHCDQFMNQKGRLLALYREARTHDPENALAADALRGLGRGVKTWRTTAALLQTPGEEALSHAERSARLRQLGDDTAKTDAVAALGWYERAIAVDPDNVGAWDAIASLSEQRHDDEYAFLAAREALEAYERVTPPSAQEAVEHARRCAQTAELARKAGAIDEARGLSHVAYAIDPNVASAALLVAESLVDKGASAEATALYTRILEQLGDSLAPEQKAHALYRRGSAALTASDLDRAHEDLRTALADVPLFAPALEAMSEVQQRQGHPVIAARHALKALLVTRESEGRGAVCRRLGELFDGPLAKSDEAGAWFELAAEVGVEDKALVRRLLTHYRRTGRAQQALVAIGELIESTTDPMELADLWAMRGSILAEHDLVAAEEALDIALSFNPAHPTAVAHLREVLEQRGDYDQLVALLDAKAESEPPDQRAEALRTMARMCFENLNDPERGEQYLQRLIDIAPTREALEQMLQIVEADPMRQGERLPLLARLLAFGPPFCDRLLDTARLIYEQGQRHWAWTLLSAVMGAAPVDAWTKATLGELRKEFERFDALNLLNSLTPVSLGALPEPGPFEAALGDVAARVFLASDDGSGSMVDGRTGPGKIFERVAEQLVMQAKLLRGQEGGPALSVLAGEVPAVVVRSDLLTAPPGELAYIYAVGMMLARPECRALACVAEDDRARIIDAIAVALDENATSDDARVTSLATILSDMLPAEQQAAWKVQLTDLAAARAKAAKAFAEVELAAMRVGLLAAGDARSAVRAIARMSPDNKRPPGVARLEDFEAFFASIPLIAQVLSFAASDTFGVALASA